jgi:hypothetical protein
MTRIVYIYRYAYVKKKKKERKKNNYCPDFSPNDKQLCITALYKYTIGSNHFLKHWAKLVIVATQSIEIPSFENKALGAILEKTRA